MIWLLLLTVLQGAVSLEDSESEARRHPHYQAHPSVWATTHWHSHHHRQKRSLEYDLTTRTTTITSSECDEDRDSGRSGQVITASSPGLTSLTYDPLTSTASVITVAGPSALVQILVDEKQPAPGTVQSTLETEGHVSTLPILTSFISSPTSLISTPSTTSVISTPAPTVKMISRDIFADPIATDSPPEAIGSRSDHPAPRLGIEHTAPIQTNKFYSNFFLGGQNAPTYLLPYSVAWAKGKGASGSWGLAVSHITADQRVFGPKTSTGAAQYYINPVGIHSLVISAKELGSETALTSDQLTDFSARINLHPSSGAAPSVRFPLVQGSTFVTAIFDGARPLIQTGVFFRTVTRSNREPKPGITKFKFYLEDGTTWLLYAHHTRGDPLSLEVVNNGVAQSNASFFGTIQVAKDPGNGEILYDLACGVYPLGVELTGSVAETTGSYTFKFQKSGMSNATLTMFALPHHQSSFDAITRAKMTGIQLDTPTKGSANLVVADSWTMVEADLPVGVAFLPWLAKTGSLNKVSSSVKAFIHNITIQELSQNMIVQSDQDSMYFAGKALAKFAAIVLAAHDILDDKPLAQAGLAQLKTAFSRFAENKQQYPLVYESAWGGVVSSASYKTGNAGVDFAAIIGHLDPSWIPINKPFVNTLVRDISNPSSKDKLFPVWRCFDWYHGHSWAHGLFESLDGKDQESSSEDSMHSYAIKMWGTVIEDHNMAARGNLMLAIQTRSFRDYYLYTTGNKVQPAEFIGNKVAGIMFENKIDHTTYFGTNIEYIQGIHMLPLLPHTPYVRTQDFVAEEWNAYFSNGRADEVVGGWKSILYGNLATIDARGAYAFFNSKDFDPSWLDGGASLTWYLCYAAVLGEL